MGTIAAQQFSDVLVTPGQTVRDVDADSGKEHCFTGSMDQASLDDATLVIHVETQIADDQPGAPDDKLVWRTDATAIWECPAGKFYRDPNPSLGTYGPSLKGKRLRCVFNILDLGKTVTMDVRYSVGVTLGP